MEAEFQRHLLVGGVPDGLMLIVPAQRDRLHIVAGHDPRHAAHLDEAGDQAAQQRFLLHVRRESNEHEAAVLEPRGEEVPRLPGERRPGEGHLAHLAPVDLQEFPRQPLEAHRHGVDREGGAHGPQRAHVIVEGGVAALKRVSGVRARHLNHALHAESLVEPPLDLVLERRGLRCTLARRRFFVQRLAQHLGDRVTMVADERADLRVRPPLLLQVVNRRAVHVSQHPSGSSALWRARGRPGLAVEQRALRLAKDPAWRRILP